MYGSQRSQKEQQRNPNRHRDHNPSADRDGIGQADEPSTPRASGLADPNSGSETEKESSQRKESKKKGKGKEKDKGKRREQRSASASTTSQSTNTASTASMPSTSRSARTSGSSSSRKHLSKGKTKTDDWSEVTDPEERRRIQNRIAQRKFREKAKEQKERAERDLRNQEHAASSYQVPRPADLSIDDELSGVPWGGLSMQYVVAKGHESASNHGSRRASEYNMADEAAYGAVGTAGAAGSSAMATTPATMGTSAYSYGDYSDDNPMYFTSDSASAGQSSCSSSDFQHQAHAADDQAYYGTPPFYYDYDHSQ